MKGSCQNLDFQFKTDDNGDDFNLYDLGGASNDDTTFGGLPELQESTDPEPAKNNGRYNLRKSLAWDSAFFTSAGVLDPEELSTMITGTDDAKKNLLPRIEEDINGSTESISTFHSDNLLESQEDDLFVDIRASIQRSSKKPSMFTNSSSKKSVTNVDNQAISALEKDELACPPSKNSEISIKKASGRQAVRTLKDQPKQITGKPGSGKALKQDSIQSYNTQVKSIARTGPSTSVPRKPPMATAKTIPNSTSTIKRATIGAVAKSGCGSLKPAMSSRKGTQPPKVPVATSVGRVLPKPSVSSKSSIASSPSSMLQSSKLSTSSDSSSSISSSSIPAARIPIMTRRNILKTTSVVTSSVTKSSPRATIKIKPSSSSAVSATMKSIKTSTSVSPASSISEWSSVSSSSSSRANARSNNSRTSIDANSRKSMDSDLTYPIRKNQATPARPSGLRLPSPKIGFFDGQANSRTPNKPSQSQSGSRNSLSRNESAASTPKRSSNIKSKSSIPTAAKVATVAKANSALSTGTAFALSKEKSLASENDALVLMGKDDAPIMSTKTTDKATGQKYDKADEVEVGAANRVIDVVTSAIAKNLGDLKKEMLNELSYASENDKFHKDNEVEVAAGNQVIGVVTSAINKNLGELKKEMEQSNKEFGVVNTDQGGSGDVMVSHNNLENNIYQVDSDKENGNVMIHQGERVKEPDRNVNISVSVPMNEVLSEILDCAVSYPAKTFTSSPVRSPFAQKNFVSDDECTSVSKVTETKVDEMRVSVLPSMEKNESC